MPVSRFAARGMRSWLPFWPGVSCASEGPVASAYPPVTILKPLYLGEPGLSDNLESFFAQDYPGPSRSCSACMTKPIPRSRWCEALQARYPHLDTVHRRRRRAVRRQRQSLQPDQYAARRAARHIGAVATAISACRSDWLRQVTGALARPGVGLVTCLYTGEVVRGDGRLWPTLSAMGTSYDFLPNVVLGTSLGLAEPCMGSTIALTRGDAGRDRRLCRFRRLSGR